MFTETPEAQAIIAWHDSQTEELLASLPGYEDGLTPRQAWDAFCSLPAEKQPGQGLAASVVHTTQKPERFRCRCRHIPKAVA